MFDAYNFDNVNDLKNFVCNLLDGYCPTQLQKLDSDLVYDAIQDLKDNKIELTGNGIYSNAVYFGISKADNQIINWKEHIDIDELTEKEIAILEKFAEKIREESGLYNAGIVDYYANGCLDSSVYWGKSIKDEDKYALNILKKHSDIINDLSENISLDLGDLEIDYSNLVEVNIVE